MALLDATKLQDAILLAKGQFGSFENRMSNYGVLKAFLDNADRLLPAATIRNMKKSPEQPVKIPVLNRGDITAITTRSCAIAGSMGTSAFVTLGWATTGFTIKLTPAKYAGNYITPEDDFAMQMANGLRKVLAVLDTAGFSALENGKATWLPSSKLATVAGGAYSLTADKLYKSIPSIMQLNDMSGPYHNVANTEAAATLLAMMSYGANNQQNQAGFLGILPGAANYMNHYSNRVDPGANSEVHYLMEDGRIGMFTWNGFEARNNMQIDAATKAYVQADPVLGIEWDVLEKTVCETDGIYQRVFSEYYEFTVDYAFVSDYSSEVGTGANAGLVKSPIIKFVTP